MKTKEEVIKEVWGEHYTERVDENGWCSIWGTSIDLKECDIIKHYQDSSADICRPKLLRGIEDNNMWIRIESESDLPKEKGDYYILSLNENIVSTYFNGVGFITHYGVFEPFKHFKYYQPIVKPNKPLY